MNMRNAVVIVELKGAPEETSMRWERTGSGENAPFELLGRAFEVALRDADADFGESLRAFFGGALLRKADVSHVLENVE